MNLYQVDGSMYRSSLFLTAALIGTNIALVQNVTFAAITAEDIGRIAESITVEIKSSNEDSIGSGVLLQQEADVFTVLTASHVIRNNSSFSIRTPDGLTHKSLPNSIRHAKNNIDLAVIKFRTDGSYDLVKTLSYNYIRIGEIIYVAGFPQSTPEIRSGTLNFTVGNIIINNKKPDKQGYSLIYSNFTRKGMSGGPVLNTDGELIAIHGKGDRDDGVKTGRNLGIAFRQFVSAAQDLGIKLSDEQANAFKPSIKRQNAAEYLQSAAENIRNGDRERALEDCDQAVLLEPKNALAYYLRAKAKDDPNIQGRSALSNIMGDYSQAIILNPKYAEAYNGRSSIKKRLNDMSGAITDINKSILLKPNDINSYSWRADLKEAINDLSGALHDLDKVITFTQSRSDLLSAYESRAKLKERMNDLIGALADCNKGIALEPEGKYLLLLSGKLKEKMNDISGALGDYSQVIEIEIARQREYELSNATTRIGPSHDINNDEYFLRGQLREKINDFSGALADFNQAIIRRSHSSELYIKRGHLKAYKINDANGALEDFDTAIKLLSKTTSNTYAENTKYPYAYFSRGYLKIHKFNDPDAALGDFNTAIRQYPNYADAYYERGVLKKEKFNYPSGAIEDIRKAARIYRKEENTENLVKSLQYLRELGASEYGVNEPI
jgi:tetratricopeptide (TPR) repeat protein